MDIDVIPEKFVTLYYWITIEVPKVPIYHR